MLIGSDIVYYVIKQMTKGREMVAGTEHLWKRTGEDRRGKAASQAKHLKALDSLATEDAVQTI